MGRSGMVDRDGGAILLARAARLWEVSRGTAYAWHRSGKVRCFREGRHGLEASLDDVRAEKVLPESSILGDRITRKLLDNAIACALVVPLGQRFSLADRDELRRLAGYGALQDPARPPERYQSGTELIAAFRWTIDAERKWVAEGADPLRLPDAFWATPKPPRFIAPADVFLYRVAKRLPDGAKGRFVWRSAGYETQGEQLIWCEASEHYDRLLEGQTMPATWTESNHRYRVGKEQWLREWVRRQSYFGAG